MKPTHTRIVLTLLVVFVLVIFGSNAAAQKPIIIGCPLSTAFLYGWDAERGVTLAITSTSGRSPAAGRRRST